MKFLMVRCTHRTVRDTRSPLRSKSSPLLKPHTARFATVWSKSSCNPCSNASHAHHSLPNMLLQHLMIHLLYDNDDEHKVGAGAVVNQSLAGALVNKNLLFQ